METGLILACAVLALAAVALLIRPLTLARGGAASRAEADRALYRAQLAELARDVERGTVTEAEAEGARVEISRRLLTADRAAEAAAGPAPAPPAASRGLAIGAAIGVPAVAVAAYLTIGTPGAVDQPYDERAGERALAAEMRRPSQERAEELLGAPPSSPAAPTAEEAEYRALVARLEQALEERPADQRGLELLVQAYLRLGRNAEAWRKQAELIALKQGLASADDNAVMAEAMIWAANGYVSPEAEAAISETLRIQPEHPAGLYYLGVLLVQQGRPGDAIEVWTALRRQFPDGSASAADIDAAIARAGAATGGGPSGPDAAAIGAAAEMTPEERRAMIEGMVTGLDERLSENGGSPEEWLRLMLSYSQLGRPEDARRAYDAALADHESDPEAQAAIRARARQIGLE